MHKKTINEAIIEALTREGHPLRVTDIYKRIKEDDLYLFNAANPEHIIRTQLRRHSTNLDFPTAHKIKHFLFLEDGTYWIKAIPHENVVKKKDTKVDKEHSTFDDIKKLHEKFLNAFKEKVQNKLTDLDPYNFEHFCKRLLEVYGFKNVKVTRKSRDGGIDGFGELKIGLAYLTVAFECKRYSKKSVDRKMINQFRGDIQGKYQQGIFFTTSDFNSGARAVSFQAGAVPIILINGAAIVDIMIEKGLGVEVELLPIYSDAIDLAF